MYACMFTCVFVFAVDETTENPPEPEEAIVDAEAEEPTPELRCDEELDDGKSTEFPAIDA